MRLITSKLPVTAGGTSVNRQETYSCWKLEWHKHFRRFIILVLTSLLLEIAKTLSLKLVVSLRSQLFGCIKIIRGVFCV